GDLVDDLAIGSPGEDINGVGNAGMVQILTGRSGLNFNFSTALARDARNLPSPFTGLQTGAGFGEALSMGDFNGDAFRIRDLAVGIPSEDVNGVADVGVVGVFAGGLTGTGPVVLPTTGTAFTAQQLGGPSATRLRFGQTLVSGDFTGDNVDDLAVAAPDQISSTG